MTILDAYPFDQGAGAVSGQTRWQKIGKVWSQNGVVSNDVTGLGGELQPSLAGGVITVQPGAVVINGTYGELAVPINVATSGNDGLLVARLDCVNYDLVIAFNGGATQPVHSTTIWETVLAQITSGNLNDYRYFVGPPTWRAYTPYWTLPGASTQPAIGNGGLHGRYLLRGTECHLRIDVTFGSTTTFGNTPGTGWNSWKFGLPPNVWTWAGGNFNEQIIPAKFWSPGPEGFGGSCMFYLFPNDNGGYLWGETPDTTKNIIYLQGMNYGWGGVAFTWGNGGNIIINGVFETNVTYT